MWPAYGGTEEVHHVVQVAGCAWLYRVVDRPVPTHVLGVCREVSAVVKSGSLEARSAVFHRGHGLLRSVAEKHHGGRFRPPWGCFLKKPILAVAGILVGRAARSRPRCVQPSLDTPRCSSGER